MTRGNKVSTLPHRVLENFSRRGSQALSVYDKLFYYYLGAPRQLSSANMRTMGHLKIRRCQSGRFLEVLARGSYCWDTVGLNLQ